MAKNVWKNGLVNGMQNSIGGEDERFSDAAIATERAETERMDGLKFKISREIKIGKGVAKAGTVMYGKNWREAMESRTAPAVWDILFETQEKITHE